MAGTILNLDTANLFAGDDDPNSSQFLTLNSIKWPDLDEKMKAHNPGGGVMAVDVGMRSLDPMTLSFKLAGIQPDVMNQFMNGSPRRKKYTIRGNLNDLKTQADIPVLGVIEGRMISVKVGEFTKDNGLDTDYMIKEVVSYSLFIDGVEKLYFDLFAGPRGVRIDGVPIFNDVARNIGLGV